MSAIQQRGQAAIPGAIGLVVAIIIVLVAQFGLDKLADSSDTWHEIQHGTFVVAGLIGGWALTTLFKLGQRPA